MFDVFKEKQVQINLIDAGLFCIGIKSLLTQYKVNCKRDYDLI